MRIALPPFARTLACLLLFGLVATPARSEESILPPQDAYPYKVSVADGGLVVRYNIVDGYYLYRDRLGFESATPGVTLGPPSLPVGEDHEDDYFGKQVIYRGTAKIGLAVKFEGAPRDFELRLKLQGCADAGLCYPPQKWTTLVKWPAGAAAAVPATTARPAAKTGGEFSLRSLFGGKGSAPSEGDFLPVDQAFVLAAHRTAPERIALHWEIADDYYLYRDKVKVATRAPGVQLGALQMPAGESKHDEYFGDQVIYRGQLIAQLPVTAPAGMTDVPIEVTYQGCADAGLCYPPTRKQVVAKLVPPGSAAEDLAPAGPGAGGIVRSEQDLLADKIREGNLFAVLATFFGMGLLLALTPCVLPMVPILSGIIVGAGGGRPVSRGRAFSLSLAYVLGMALTYTIAGAAFAAAGQQAQAFFQKPWIVVAFAALFVWLALGMFGVFNLQVPAALQTRLASLSNQQKQGTLLGTAIMGALSSLIVTACVAPPLVASLAVIGQSGDVVRGGAALFALSLGMGAPLLIVGASAGQLLPKAGPWMDAVKAVFGVMMLGVAIWMLGRVLPGPLTLGLWAALAFFSGYALIAMGAPGKSRGLLAFRRGIGAFVLLCGVLLLVGALSGSSDPLRPLAGLAGPPAGESPAAGEHVAFKRIKSIADLDREIAAARAAGRPVMLDFYADWCVSCKEMEKLTFPDPAVRRELARAVLLQADVTANDAEDQALLQRFDILGPPTIVFFGADGTERPQFRVVGFKPAQEFSAHAAQAFGGPAA
jgi:thiol:disulfide interchange protein DsbD